MPKTQETFLPSACVCVPQICSLMRGGIAERGGVRVGHRIIEINGQSVVATAHEKIVQALSNSVGEVKLTHTHTPCRGDFLIDLLTKTELYFSFFFCFLFFFLTDPHEDHAGSHVQTSNRTGDTHVHINNVLHGTGCQLRLVNVRGKPSWPETRGKERFSRGRINHFTFFLSFFFPQLVTSVPLSSLSSSKKT